jgi:hypothetical protein
MTPQAILPAIVVPTLYAWIFYRRARRNFGRQPYQPKRMTFRIVILSVLAALLLYASAHHSALLAAGLGGLLAGAVTGVVGLRLTRFESGPDGFFYTPNTYIGVGLSALFIGRLVYRFVSTGQLTGNPSTSTAVGQAGASANPWAAFTASPLTLAIFTLIVGYYVTYFVGVMLRARNATVT